MKWFCTAFFSLFGVLLWADIAPMEYHGGGIVPVSVSTIKMESADVEIIWGTPCVLRAKFVMHNVSDTNQDVQLGFPMPSDEYNRAHILEKLTIAFDGVRTPVDGPVSGTPGRVHRTNWIWYQCKHSFVPGKTTVEVSTTMQASEVYAAPFRERLRYCIETGRNWVDAIGKETVTITFPTDIARDQIIEVKPANGKVEGSRVTWVFENFKPAGNEFDIDITYVHPRLMSEITRLRNELKHHPESATTAVRLAKCLLVLGYAKSNSGFLPERFSNEEYENIVASIGSKKDRRIFTKHYVKAADTDVYQQSSSEWTRERRSLVMILATAGYRDEDSQISFVREGEALLLDVLKKDSRNAEAWNVYLANYWRFHYAAYGHWFGSHVLTKKQASIIRQASKNCPNDKCIRLWKGAVDKSWGDDSDLALREAIRQNKYDLPDFLDWPNPSLPDLPES
ncbi:hypothetical protein M2447_001689 [Ereboglobus sp. PH5-10]|uniref:DUF4424 family protein n=1 Tax=Ereboglobus sp. PH5-10 TaxID=2940629 RepID=UPI0024065D08|nr:DUF4424 family protein [Ereboglobus sp. PH5-10]MDF9827591.1 hypothetical protein [Ereboglobus sp. PH5-10]